MAARGPQNGRRGLERGPTLGYWALPSTFAKQSFWSEHSFYEKRSRRRMEWKKWKMENNGENSGPLTSLQVDRLTATDCNAGAHAKKPLAPGLHLGVFILILYLQNQCIFSVFLIKLTKFGCLLCLNGGSYGPENYFFWSSCGWTSGWWIMAIRNFSIVMDDPSQRQMFLRGRI